MKYIHDSYPISINIHEHVYIHKKPHLITQRIGNMLYSSLYMCVFVYKFVASHIYIAVYIDKYKEHDRAGLESQSDRESGVFMCKWNTEAFL